MLKQVKKCIASEMNSAESFDSYFLKYVKKTQDQNIDREVRNQLRFSLFQLSHLDAQIEVDYRKLVNDQNAKFA